MESTDHRPLTLEGLGLLFAKAVEEYSGKLELIVGSLEADTSTMAECAGWCDRSS